MKERVLTLAVVALLFNSCKKEKPGLNEIFIQSDKWDAFNPPSITVSQGTTITWTNKKNEKHTVTSDDGLLDSGDLDKGKKFSYTFSTAGTFRYHCMHHSAMRGTVIVQ